MLPRALSDAKNDRAQHAFLWRQSRHSARARRRRERRSRLSRSASPDGHQSQAQIEAFDDSWHWNPSAEQAFDEVMQSGNSDGAERLRAMRSFLKENDMMAYLAM